MAVKRNGGVPMPFRKQEFYEGAALHVIARAGQVRSIRYAAPFFLFNDWLSVMLKYSTKGRSPWGFTFTTEEQKLLQRSGERSTTALGLICGGDGIAALSYDAFLKLALPRESTIHIACYRDHGEHYEVSGPDGVLERKIAPSSWQKILDPRAV